MLSPNAGDPRRKDELTRKATDPSAFGYTGPRRMPAQITHAQAEQLRAREAAATKPDKKAVAALEKRIGELEKSLLAADENVLLLNAFAAMLVNGEDFGADGKPDADRVSALAGRDVSAAERDAAWDALRDFAEANRPAQASKKSAEANPPVPSADSKNAKDNPPAKAK